MTPYLIKRGLLERENGKTEKEMVNGLLKYKFESLVLKIFRFDNKNPLVANEVRQIYDIYE